MDAAHEELDPERVLLGLSHHESARGHDRSSVQQPNAVGHEHDLDRGPQHSHADFSGGFRLASPRAHSVPARNHPGKRCHSVAYLRIRVAGDRREECAKVV